MNHESPKKRSTGRKAGTIGSILAAIAAAIWAWGVQSGKAPIIPAPIIPAPAQTNAPRTGYAPARDESGHVLDARDSALNSAASTSQAARSLAGIVA